MKTCSTCKTEQPVENYYVQRGKPMSFCKTCKAAKDKAYRQANKEKVNARNRAYRQTEQYKAWEAEHLAKPEIAARNLEHRRAWQKRNAETERIRKRELSANRRAAMREQDNMPQGYWNLLVDFYGLCLSCGSTAALSHDHVIPVSWGGHHSLRNAQVLCGLCNSRKGNHHSTDYRDYQAGVLAAVILDQPAILTHG